MNMHQPRPAYTLIELLVVIALIAVLAALTVTFLPNAASSQKESRAAMNVQTWLNIAKQNALRKQATCGVRFSLVQPQISLPPGSLSPGPWNAAQQYVFGDIISDVNYPYRYRCIQPNTNTPPPNVAYWAPWTMVADAQNLEQPEDFSDGLIVSPNPAPVGYSRTNCLQFTADVTNGYAPVVSPNFYNTNDSNRLYWNVQPGDYLEVLGTGLVTQIVQIGVVIGANVNSNLVVINPPLGFPIDQPSRTFRVVRSPRPVGEDLKMPDGTFIDFGTNWGTYGFSSPLPPITNPSIGSGFVDILFSPSGAVISPGVTTGNINLWIRAPFPGAESDPYRGDPSIISVFVKTGLVGSFPPVNSATPYSLVY